jgi:hypothetical protein
MTDLRQAAKLALEALELSSVTVDSFGVQQATQKAITALRTALAVPEQEPVAWMVYTQDGQSVYVTDNPTDIKEGQRALPLYTTPPAAQPKWQGLTDTEIGYQAKKDDHGVYFALGALWAEAKLKERNT